MTGARKAKWRQVMSIDAKTDNEPFGAYHDLNSERIAVIMR